MTKKIERQAHHKPDAPHTNTQNPIFSPAEKISNKQETNVIAQLALKGYATRRVEGGGFYVSRWNLAKFCRDLADLQTFAAEVGI